MTAVVLARPYMNVKYETNVGGVKTQNNSGLPLLQRQLSIPNEDVPLVKRALSNDDKSQDVIYSGILQRRRKKLNVKKKTIMIADKSNKSIE